MLTLNLRPTEAKENSWKLFGTNFDGKVTIEEAIKQAGLDYVVEEEPLMRVPKSLVEAIRNGEDNITFNPTIESLITSHKATFRTDTNVTLGCTGSGYGIVQNSKAFEFINFLKDVSGQEPVIETAGALGYGERVFVTCRLGDDMYLNGHDDAIKNYIVFTTSHDGSGAVMMFISPTRVICQNSLNIAIANAPNKITFKHTKNVNLRIDFSAEENRKKAVEVFARSADFTKKFLDNMLFLKGQTLTTEEVRDITHKMFLKPAQMALFKLNGYKLDGIEEISTQTKNQIESFKDSLEYGIGQNNYRGTKLWMLNGITTMQQNDRKWKNEEAKFVSLIEGDAAKKTQKMYDMLMAA